MTHRLDGSTLEEEPTLAQRQPQQELIGSERAAVIQLRDKGKIADDVLRAIERELDLEEQ